MIYGYIFVMAGVTYLIRMLPLTLIQKKITNIYIRSFLYYIPYACLTAMTFPAILYATKSPVSGAAGLLTAVILALRKKSLIKELLHLERRFLVLIYLKIIVPIFQKRRQLWTGLGIMRKVMMPLI